jgi:ribosomal protein L37AE/L43A
MIYDHGISSLYRRIVKARLATVLHHETCPVCGRKLVNIYRRGNDWKCLQCWKAADQEAPHE